MFVLLLALMVSVCLGQVQDASTANAGPLANDTANASSTAGADSITHTSESRSSVSVQGIWKISLGEKDVVAAISQSGESIFGWQNSKARTPGMGQWQVRYQEMQYPDLWPRWRLRHSTPPT